MTPEGIAWQILKGPDRMDRDRAQFTGLAGYPTNQPYGDITRDKARGMSRTGQRAQERRMVFDENERAKQKPVDSEFDSQEDEEQEADNASALGMNVAQKKDAQREAMQMLGRNLAQQRQPGM